jgi:hypothetical protein
MRGFRREEMTEMRQGYRRLRYWGMIEKIDVVEDLAD